MEFNNCIEKTYCLYASDWHLTIMLLPFISKRLYEKDRIYMKFENSIEDKVKQLTSKLEFKNKDEINDIRWNIEIGEEDYSPNEKIYIVAGSDEYIEEMNSAINQYYRCKNCKVKIVNCFDICKCDKNNDLLVNNRYDNVLTTKGETIISVK